MKKLISVTLTTAMLLSSIHTVSFADKFDWAKEAVDFCVERKILSGMEDGDLNLGGTLTREQMAKIMCDAFGFDSVEDDGKMSVFSDVPEDRWSYKYINAIYPYMFAGKGTTTINPADTVTREEFAATLILAYGLKESNVRHKAIIDDNFKDYKKVSDKYKILLSIAVERGLMSGADGELNPKGMLNRAEACSLMYRAVSVKEGTLTITPDMLGVIQSQTSLMGKPQVLVDDAKKWAKSRGATDAFVDAADIYWKYGEIFGIRPEVLYAQSAKETGYGKYGGAVLPEQNNFAGIKVFGATGDRTEDHETFATQDDGVRGHFNHMSAYIGIDPVGEPHGRYNSVKSLPWAGTVKTVEGLGGKWCPDIYYGFSVLHNYIEPMMNGN